MPTQQHTLKQPVAELYLAHHHWLQQWLLRRLRCRHDADDLTQDTFVQVMKANKVEQIQTPRSYLASIAKALAVNLFRRRTIEQAYLESLSALPESVAESPEDHYASIETLIEIDTALSDLPSKVRQAFLLSRLEGLTYQAIAERMNVTERTIKNYMAQAMVRCLVVAQQDTQ